MPKIGESSPFELTWKEQLGLDSVASHDVDLFDILTEWINIFNDTNLSMARSTLMDKSFDDQIGTLYIYSKLLPPPFNAISFTEVIHIYKNYIQYYHMNKVVRLDASDPEFFEKFYDILIVQIGQ